MAIIILTRGFKTIIDDHLYEELSTYKWYASGLDGRPARRLKNAENPERKLILMYHQILKVWPWELRSSGKEVDHIDGDPLNNKIENLRVVSHTENMRNTPRSFGKEGIGYDATHDRWKVYIDRYDQPRLNIGTFKELEEARLALVKAKEQYQC